MGSLSPYHLFLNTYYLVKVHIIERHVRGASQETCERLSSSNRK